MNTCIGRWMSFVENVARLKKVHALSIATQALAQIIILTSVVKEARVKATNLKYIGAPE